MNIRDEAAGSMLWIIRVVVITFWLMAAIAYPLTSLTLGAGVLLLWVIWRVVHAVPRAKWVAIEWRLIQACGWTLTAGVTYLLYRLAVWGFSPH